MTMMHERSMIMLIFLSAALATPTLAQTRDILGDNYSIIVPQLDQGPTVGCSF
jgi:hypothetical protein